MLGIPSSIPSVSVQSVECAALDTAVRNLKAMSGEAKGEILFEPTYFPVRPESLVMFAKILRA